MEIPSLLCLRCGHTWYPRKPAKPFTCPKCTSPYWDRLRRASTKSSPVTSVLACGNQRCLRLGVCTCDSFPQHDGSTTSHPE